MDYDNVLKLLDVVRETAGHPKLKPIHDAAMGELEKLATPKKEENGPRPAVRPSPEFRRDV